MGTQQAGIVGSGVPWSVWKEKKVTYNIRQLVGKNNYNACDIILLYRCILPGNSIHKMINKKNLSHSSGCDHIVEWSNVFQKVGCLVPNLRDRAGGSECCSIHTDLAPDHKLCLKNKFKKVKSVTLYILINIHSFIYLNKPVVGQL